MRLDPAGLPFVGGVAALALAVGLAWDWQPATPVAALSVLLAFFFRDPNRRIPEAPDVVVSPADGRVLHAGPAMPEAAPPGAWRQVSVFLSPLDVHVNRVPISGRVARVVFTPGRFLPAYRRDAGAANERCEIWIDHEGQAVVARQVVGVLARRVVCRLSAGAEVRTGDRYGVMKFGSRMDVFLPETATLAVKTGDRVRAGETVVAVLHSTDGRRA